METTVIAIAGGTGSGKSTLAREVAGALGATIIAVDDYYRPLDHLTFDERDRVNFDDPCAIDAELLYAQIALLMGGTTIEKPRYDFTRHTRFVERERVAPAPYVIVEGIFALCWPALNALCSPRVFVDAPRTVRFARRLERDVLERGRDADEVQRRFLNHVEPMHCLHVEPSRRHSTVQVRGDEPIAVATRQLLEAIGADSPRPQPTVVAG